VGSQSSPTFGAQDLATGRDTNLVFGPGFIGDNNAMPANPARPAPNSRYGNGLYIQNFYDERLNHLSMYNPDLVRTIKSSSQSWDRVFGVDEMRILNEQYNFNNRERFQASDLATLARNTLGPQLPGRGPELPVCHHHPEPGPGDAGRQPVA